MPSLAVVTKLTSAALVASVVTAAVLRAIGNASWHSAFVVALVLLGARMLVLARRASLGEVAWSRLLLPSILVLEAVGLAWPGVLGPWALRLGAALALEVAFVAIAIRELRRSSIGTEPLETRLARAFGALVSPGIAQLAACELVIIGSALWFLAGGWRRPTPPGFSYHRESGLRLLLPILPLLALGDILLLELVLLPHAAIWLRVVFHAIALYGLLWLVGLYASLRARPHQLVERHLRLRRGILRCLDLSVADIAAIAPLPTFTDDWKQRAYKRGALRLDIAGPPVLELRLHTAARAVGVLGLGPAGTRVLVAVDEPATFIAAIRSGEPS